MERLSTAVREELSAALLAVEDQFAWDTARTLEVAVDLEDRANALHDDELVMRARLCQANMWMRQGEIGAAVRRIWEIDKWARDHGARMVQARANLVWANAHRFLGDPAACLEHSLLAVELLDDDATVHAQVWHRGKLADALGQAGSIDAARAHYAQAARAAAEHRMFQLEMAVLNNWAYNEHNNGFAAAAHEVAQRLQAVADEHGFELDPADLDTIGSIQIANGRYAEAERTLLLALDRGGPSETADSIAVYLLTLATAQRGLGATDKAQASLDASRKLCDERGLGETLVRVLAEQAELHAARGDFAAAFEAHKAFFTAHNRLHSSKREAQARARQAMFETSEARQEAERFREQARRDPLTGLRNRRYVDEQLPVMITEADPVLTVAIVDLDHFKRINDELSHDVGDQVLVMAAKLLETELAAVRPDGFVARLGGEEFLVVLPGVTAARAAEQLDRMRVTVRSYAWHEITRGLPVTVSIGVASTDDVARPSQSGLLSTADRHLYVAKHGGRDRVVMAGDWDISLRRSCRDGGAPGPTGGGRPDRKPVGTRSTPDPAAEAPAPPGVDVTVPHSARIYDYWLGGKDNFAMDRAVGDAMAAAIPGLRAMAAENRRFVHRATRHLVADLGIRQFLDIGTGIPTRPNLHEVAQQEAPETRVVYVDNDPIVLVHARALMVSTPPGRSDYIAGDLRRPRSILDDRRLTATLDLSRPVALTAIAVLMLLGDADDPVGNLHTLLDALPSGSCLAITHPTGDFAPAQMARAVDAATGAGMTLVPRDRAGVLRFFADWPLLEPGLVPVRAWRPDGGPVDDPESAYYWAGLARKP